MRGGDRMVVARSPYRVGEGLWTWAFIHAICDNAMGDAIKRKTAEMHAFAVKRGFNKIWRIAIKRNINDKAEKWEKGATFDGLRYRFGCDSDIASGGRQRDINGGTYMF